MKLASFKGVRPGVAGLFSIGCKWWLNGPYTHTELIFSDGWAGTSRATEGGVVLHKIDYPPEDWDIIEIDGDEAYARKWFEDHVGAKFDYFGLLGFVWRPEEGQQTRWFCVESIGDSLKFPEAFRYECNSFRNIFKRGK